MIEVQNPNYVKTKSARKLGEVDPNDAKPVLTRREREEIEAQRLAAEAEAALIKQEMEQLAIIRQVKSSTDFLNGFWREFEDIYKTVFLGERQRKGQVGSGEKSEGTGKCEESCGVAS